MSCHIKNIIMDELKVGHIIEYKDTKGVVVDIHRNQDSVYAEVDFNGKVMTLPQHSPYNPVDLCVDDAEVFSGEEQDLADVPSNYITFIKRTTVGSLKIGDLVVLKDKTITPVVNKAQPRCADQNALVTVYVDHVSEQFSCSRSTPVYVLAVERRKLKKC